MHTARAAAAAPSSPPSLPPPSDVAAAALAVAAAALAAVAAAALAVAATTLSLPILPLCAAPKSRREPIAQALRGAPIGKLGWLNEIEMARFLLAHCPRCLPQPL